MRLIDTDAIEEDYDEELYTDYIDDYAKGFQAGLWAVINQPTIEYGTWIPVSSGKLPDVNREVWVVLKHTYEDDYQEYSVARYIDTGNNEHHWCDNHYGYLEWDKYSNGRGGCSRYKVVAWMYIEPYREEKKDE